MDAAQRQRLRRVLGVCLPVLAGGLLVVLVLRPRCPILRVTGLYCPGCGGQRMIYALLRGDFPAAFGYNPFLFVLLPPAAVFAAAELTRYVRGKPLLLRTGTARVILAALVLLALVFMVLRNLPGLSFLAPE